MGQSGWQRKLLTWAVTGTALAGFSKLARAQDSAAETPPPQTTDSASPPTDHGEAPAPSEVLTLEDFLNRLVFVASRKEADLQSVPGIVTVFTSEEIRRSGARDLTELLLRVPGIYLGVDVQGVVGLGMRGNWAHEGKVLLLVDGIEMNEPLYGTNQFGYRYPLEALDRVEILRGPGSALYGGYAETAVIHLITKKGEQLKGARFGGEYGGAGSRFGQAQGFLSAGSAGAQGSWSTHLRWAEGHVGQGNYTDSVGHTRELSALNRQQPEFAEVQGTFGNWEGRVLIDNYRTKQIDAFGENMSRPFETDFLTQAAQLRYTAHFGSDWKVLPELQFKRQRPWRTDDPASQELSSIYYNRRDDRLQGRLVAVYEPASEVSLSIGTEFLRDDARDDLPGKTFTSTGTNKISFHSETLLAEGSFKLGEFNLTLGGRVEKHNKYDAVAVPRAAITRKFGKFHAKLLLSQAYRAPSIENIEGGVNIQPEKIRVAEIELGYRFTDSQFLAANVFDNRITRTIVYSYSGGVSGYRNFDRVGTRGLELDYRWTQPGFHSSATYSFYTSPENAVDLYAVQGHKGALLAFPQHKLTWVGSYELPVPRLFLSPTLIWVGQRYGYAYDAATAGVAQKRFSPYLLANLFLNYEDAWVPGLRLGVGVSNIFKADAQWIQPYSSGHPPIPALPREWLARADYRWSF